MGEAIFFSATNKWLKQPWALHFAKLRAQGSDLVASPALQTDLPGSMPTVSRDSPEVRNLNPHSVTWPRGVWYMGVSGSLLSPFVCIPQCAHLNPGWEGFLCLYLHCFAPAVHSAEFLINFPSCFCFSLLSTLLGNFLPLSLSRCHAGCFPSPQRVTRCLIVLFSRLSSPSRQRPH